jgi:metal-responsive CopG/Arc/MetJ family transcriptional regulator
MAARHADEKRTVVVSRIEPALVTALDQMAEEDRRSRSEMIEQAVREMVEKRKGRKKAAKQG